MTDFQNWIDLVPYKRFLIDLPKTKAGTFTYKVFDPRRKLVPVEADFFNTLDQALEQAQREIDNILNSQL